MAQALQKYGPVPTGLRYDVEVDMEDLILGPGDGRVMLQQPGVSEDDGR